MRFYLEALLSTLKHYNKLRLILSLACMLALTQSMQQDIFPTTLCIHDFKLKNGGKDLASCRRALFRLRSQCESAMRQIHYEGRTLVTIEIDSLFDGIDYAYSLDAEAVIRGKKRKMTDELENWLRNLDDGCGRLLCYLPLLKREFDNLHQIAASYKPLGPGLSLLKSVDPAIFDAMRVEKVGHRLLIAQGIKALSQLLHT